MGIFIDGAPTLIRLIVIGLCFVGVTLLGLRIGLRRRVNKAQTSQQAKTLTPADVLAAFMDEAEEILRAARTSTVADSTVDAVIDDFHDRVSVFLFRKFGIYTAKRLHDHDGYRLFIGAYPASLSAERIRLCRHIETDIRRLQEFLNRTTSAAVTTEDSLNVSQPDQEAA